MGKRHEVTAVVGASNKSISIHMKATCVSEEKYIADSRNEDDYDSGNGEEAQEDEMEDNDASDDWNWDGCDDDSNIKTNLRLWLCILYAFTFFRVFNNNMCITFLWFPS